MRSAKKKLEALKRRAAYLRQVIWEKTCRDDYLRVEEAALRWALPICRSLSEKLRLALDKRRSYLSRISPADDAFLAYLSGEGEGLATEETSDQVHRILPSRVKSTTHYTLARFVPTALI